jgi:aspartate carbamoyltransferase catalytic subunit
MTQTNTLKIAEPETRKNIIGISRLSLPFIEQILDKAQFYADAFNGTTPLPQALKGKIILGLFLENSTRTRLSFEIAVKRLGGEFVLMTADGSSLKKGESDFDTCVTLNAYSPDALVVRHSDDGFASFAAKHMSCPVLNAGDGIAEHPTQALLDALTIRQHFGDIKGLNVTICGDTRHSRVAHSNARLLTLLGAKVRFVGPDDLLDNGCDGVETTNNFDAALSDSDVVMMLRIQRERLPNTLKIDFKKYINLYSLTRDRLDRCQPHCMVMHPGPMNRGVEISDDVADLTDRTLITRQVENGVFARMACLDLVLG